MVAHDDLGFPGFDHGPHDMQRFTDMRSAIHDIADKHRLAHRVPVHTVDSTVPHAVQQQAQADRTAVYITDQIDPVKSVAHKTPLFTQLRPPTQLLTTGAVEVVIERMQKLQFMRLLVDCHRIARR